MDKKYYWIKLKNTFMTSETVDFLMAQKDGANYVVLYQMLCLKTANTNGELGRVIGEILIPYDEEKITRDCKWFSIDTVRIALTLYKKLGLIYQQDNGLLKISNFENLVGSETKYAIKQRNYRENKLPKLENGVVRLNREMLKLPNGKTRFIDEVRYGGNGAKALDMACCKCEVCGTENNLIIHHNKQGSNELEDLYVLCASCHSKVHNKWFTLSTHSYTPVSTQDIRDKILDIRDKNKDIEKEILKKESVREKITHTPLKNFIIPSLEEIKEYCEERNNLVDCDRFYDFYQSKGWMIGKNKMKDWKAAIRTWEKEAGFKNISNKETAKETAQEDVEESYQEAFNELKKMRENRRNGGK